jgi:acetyltransferase-like isoleucine patch superfamily enzyme
MANFIHPTAIIGKNVVLGDNNYIGAYCIIGDPAEHKKYWDKEEARRKRAKDEYNKKIAELGKLSTAELPGYFSKRYNSK